MVLADALISIPQSERGGEIAQRGFDYQSCWALSEMLGCELNGKDYVYIFEYHDDVLIIDSEDNPQSITFVQVKTREGQWTASSLYKLSAKAMAEKKVSIIGKLFLVQRSFSNYQTSLLFVTNAVFYFPKTGGKASFYASDLEEKERKNIQKEILKQLDITDEVDLSALKFSQSTLSLEDHTVHLTGKICDFLEQKYGADTPLRARAVMRLLTTECREKSKVKSTDIFNFADLVKKKGFSSKAFNTIINSLHTSDSLKPNWQMASLIFNDLNRQSIHLIRLQAIFSRVCISLDKSGKSASSIYLEHANSLYNQDSVSSSISAYLTDTIGKINQICPDYALTLSLGEQECIVVYSIIQKLIKDGET